MNFGLIQSIWTIIVMVVFIGIFIWAWSSGRKNIFDEASRIPMDDDEPANQEIMKEEKTNG